jgi:hypothetical protein
LFFSLFSGQLPSLYVGISISNLHGVHPTYHRISISVDSLACIQLNSFELDYGNLFICIQSMGFQIEDDGVNMLHKWHSSFDKNPF